MINCLMSWLRSRIKQNTSLGVQLPTNSIEEPSVGIDLFAILLLEHQDDLDRDLYISFPSSQARPAYQVVRITWMRLYELRRSINR